VLLSDLAKENNTSETTVGSANEAIKERCITVDEETRKKVRERQQNNQGASTEPYIQPSIRFVYHLQIYQNYWEKLEVKYGADVAGKRDM